MEVTPENSAVLAFSGRLEGEHLVGHISEGVSQAAVAKPVVVGVAVDHAWHDRLVGEV